jgi:hypothetical protein
VRAAQLADRLAHQFACYLLHYSPAAGAVSPDPAADRHSRLRCRVAGDVCGREPRPSRYHDPTLCRGALSE